MVLGITPRTISQPWVQSQVQPLSTLSRSAAHQNLSQDGFNRIPFGAIHSLKPSSVLRFSGSSSFQYDPKASIVNRLKDRAKNPATANLPAVGVADGFSYGPGVSMTNGELWKGSVKMAHVLQERYHIHPGDRVAVIESDTPEFLEILFATLALGATLLPINILALSSKNVSDPLDKEKKLAHMIEVSHCKALFIGKVIAENPRFKDLLLLKTLSNVNAFASQHAAFKSGIRHFPSQTLLLPFLVNKAKSAQLIIKAMSPETQVVLPNELSEALSAASDQEAGLNLCLTPSAESPALLLFTSGTTSLPKGVPVSQAFLSLNIHAMSQAVNKIMGAKTDHLLMPLPLFHIYGLYTLLSAMELGVPVTMIPSSIEASTNPKAVLNTIAKQKISVFPGIGKLIEPTFQYVAEHPEEKAKLNSLKYVISGGEAMEKKLYDLIHQVAPQVKVLQGYGMTEIGVTHINMSGEFGHVGQAIDSANMQMQIRQPDQEGRGLIYVKLPYTSPYVGASQEQISSAYQADGWFNTGDVGRVDSQGNLQILSREDDSSKRNGEKVFLVGFDNRLKNLLPIENSMTVKVRPSLDSGERFISIVVPKNRAGGDPKSLMQKLEALRNQKRIENIYMPDAILPVTPEQWEHQGFVTEMGKVQYKVGREYVNRLLAEHAIALRETEPGKYELTIQQPDKL